VARTRRNRRSKTGQRRITRGTRRGCARASCTDSTADRTDGTRGAGIIRRPGPRTGPRPRPLRPHILLLCVNVADDMDPRPQADRAPGPTVDLYAATHTVRLADARICEMRVFRLCMVMRWPGCRQTMAVIVNSALSAPEALITPIWSGRFICRAGLLLLGDHTVLPRVRLVPGLISGLAGQLGCQ
jgi:hypothetical protein